MYSPSDLERKVGAFWERENIYEKAKALNAGKQKFYFNDGPPYVTGAIHPGTAWNKCLKDAVCRYKRMRGFDVRAQPGFDTHGLPIEVKVEQELGFRSKKDIERVGIEKFIEKCRAFATKYISVMSEQFKGIGVWMDWDDPYVTYRDEYMERSWKTIAKASEKGLLERGEYVLPYCPRCETTLANYELEYGEQADPSIYVKFKVAGRESDYLIIWTTTPWTLVGNMAVMAHPEFTYVKAKVGSENWIMAKERLDAVMAVFNPLEGGRSAVIVEEFSGRKLDGLKYVHPLLDEVPKQKEFAKKYHYVTLSDRFVTLEEGTGLVHTAPGHGPQDFEIGKREGMPAFCPVDASGCYTTEAGKYAGQNVRKANSAIANDLREKGTLLHAGVLMHRYPHCWRCKTPLIFITTDQWFIKISKMREKMLAEIERCRWQPDFARVWFRDFVTSAPDWCISRQRYWGIPLPIWVCDKCGNTEVFGERKALEERWGKKIHELHRPHIDRVVLKCPKCGGSERRVPDILDVWFDSGNSIWASLGEKELARWYPCDFIVEGKDQIRGWFYSLLGSGVVAYDEIPYRSLLMHGHFLDERGEKMSKSLGNFVPPEEITGKYGADTFRLWSMSSVVWEDLRFNWDALKDAHRALGIFWNMGIYLKRATEAGPATHPSGEPELEDQWLLSRLNALVRDCTQHMDRYEIHEAARKLRFFIVEDLSRFYLKLAKKRLAEGRNPGHALAALREALRTCCVLIAPLAPFVSEAIYQEVFRKDEKAESVFLLPWPACETGRIDPALEKQMSIVAEAASAFSNARQGAGVKLRWPLEEVLVSTQSTEVRGAFERLSDVVERLANVKRVVLVERLPTVLSFKVRHDILGQKFRREAREVAEALQNVAPENLRANFGADGKYVLETKAKKHTITPDMVEFSEGAPEGYARTEFPGGVALLKTRLNRELYSEAIAREVARRIQQTRKEMGLVERDLVDVNVVAGKETLELLESQRERLAKEVRARELVLSSSKKLKGEEKKWELEEGEITIVIKR